MKRAFAAFPEAGHSSPVLPRGHPTPVESICDCRSFKYFKLADRLKAGGFTEEQARTAASALAEASTTADIATKVHLRDLEQRLTIRLGPMLVIAVGVLLAAIRYLPGHR